MPPGLYHIICILFLENNKLINHFSCVWLERRKWWKIGGGRCFFPCSTKILFLQIWKENRRKRNNYNELPRACLLFYFFISFWAWVVVLSLPFFLVAFSFSLFLFFPFLAWFVVLFFLAAFSLLFSPWRELCCFFIYLFINYIFCFFFPWHELWCYLFIFWV